MRTFFLVTDLIFFLKNDGVFPEMSTDVKPVLRRFEVCS
jgi:hypothetical protein